MVLYAYHTNLTLHICFTLARIFHANVKTSVCEAVRRKLFTLFIYSFLISIISTFYSMFNVLTCRLTTSKCQNCEFISKC